MSCTSRLVGDVIDTIPTKSIVVNEEQFYTIQVKFRDCTIPLLISEYNLEKSYSGRIAVTGYLIANKTDVEKKFDYYFVVNAIDRAMLDEDLTNEVNIDVRVTSQSKLKPNSFGVDVLPLVASDYTPFHTTSILYLCARGRVARMLAQERPVYRLKAKGFLKQYRDIYEILITSAENLQLTTVTKS